MLTLLLLLVLLLVEEATASSMLSAAVLSPSTAAGVATAADVCEEWTVCSAAPPSPLPLLMETMATPAETTHQPAAAEQKRQGKQQWQHQQRIASQGILGSVAASSATTL
jgi:hypothetical protein